MSASIPPLSVAAPRRARESRSRGVALWCALGWLGLLAVLAVVVDVLPLPAYDAPAGDAATPAFQTFPEFLGTDGVGRSVLSRLVHGARISLTVSVGATLIAGVVGGLIGMLAAYWRGAVEAVADVLIDTMLAFPPLLLLLALAAVVRPGVTTLTVSLGVLFVPPFARLAKATTRAQLSREYVVAARAMGAGHGRLLFRELLPNCLPPIAAYGVVVMALVIVIEGALSFLGVGVPPPSPSWGAMIAGGKDALYDAPSLVLVPCAAMFLTVLALNAIGERLRTRFEPAAQEHGL